MARPLFSHHLVFKERPLPAIVPTWTWAASPPADPTLLPAGQLARNNATLAATTHLYVNVIDSDQRDHTFRYASTQAGSGAGQADLIIVANKDTRARYKIIALGTLAGGAIYDFTVTLVAVVGPDPPVTGSAWAVTVSYIATA